MAVGDGWDFTVVIPKGWYIREPDLSLRSQSINEFADGLIAEDPDLAPQRAEMIERYQTFSADADEKFAIIAAMLWEPNDEIPVAADLRIHEAEREIVDDLEAELARIQRMLEQTEQGDLGPREVEIVELPAGPAVRIRLLSQTDPDVDGSTIALDVVQYWLPVPDQADIVLLAGFTPNLVSADEIIGVFDEIAATLELQPSSS